MQRLVLTRANGSKIALCPERIVLYHELVAEDEPAVGAKTRVVLDTGDETDVQQDFKTIDNVLDMCF